MMARTKPIRRSYGAGEWGRNRVRVFPDPKTGLFQIEWRDNGRRLTRSLKHRDWRRAKRQADEFAAGYLGPELHRKAEAEPEPLTLERLFDKEKNPTRVVLSDEEYRALLQVSRRVDWRFHVALVLAHETGHRIGAIRQLRWSDIDFEEKVVLWRAEHEKTGFEHRTPVTAEAVAVLEEARQINPGNGDAPVLPAPWDPSTSFSRARAYVWWNRAERLAGLKRMRGRGWHSLRRKFACDLMDLPLKVLCELAAGRRPRPCSGATSRPTRYNSGRLWRAATRFAPDPIGGSQTAGIRSGMLVSSLTPIRYESASLCRLGLPQRLRWPWAPSIHATSASWTHSRVPRYPSS